MSDDLNQDEIYLWEIKQLWNAYKTLEDPKENTIKDGYQLLVPIWYFTEEWYEINPSGKITTETGKTIKGTVTIKGYGKYALHDFMHEKEKRQNYMRKRILEEMQNGKIIIGRITGE